MDETLEKYLSVLNDEQKAAVVHEGSSLLILAGAGSGKTRVITTKIAYLIREKDLPPFSILSVTFTKKAANEMKERAVAMEPTASQSMIRTFHSFGSWFLRRYYEAAKIAQNFTVYDDDDMVTLVKKACPELKKNEFKVVAHQISLAKDYFLTPEDDLSEIGSEFDLNDCYKRYEQRLRATGNIDFGDLIMLPAIVMQKHPDIADYIHNRFRVIMVDEYQDSNIAQFKLLQQLSGAGTPNPAYVCVVGDDDQSIYRFRGAEVRNILEFPERFPGTEIIRLEKNYRSTEKILNAASLVVENNKGRLGKTLVADRGEGKQPVMVFTLDQTVEAKFCADIIEKYMNQNETEGKHHHYKDWAITYRTNAQSAEFEREFNRRKIPNIIFGSVGFFEREEIKDTLAYLSLCANPRDEISFRRIVNKPTRGIGEKTQDNILVSALVVREEEGELIQYYENLFETMEKLKPELSKKAREGAEAFIKMFQKFNNYFEDYKDKKLSDFIERVILDSGLEEYYIAEDEIEGSTKKDNLWELVNMASDGTYECNMDGLAEFLDSVNLDRTVAADNATDDGDAVTLITLHNTKGLEFKNVVITGLEEGIFPRNGKTDFELEEERRLFYVGITRARNRLYVTLAQQRRMYGHTEFMRPSIFAKEAAPAFKLLGKVPFGFSVNQEAARKVTQNYGTFGKDASIFGTRKDESENFGEKAFIAKKYSKGTKIYHDDYGNGIVVSGKLNEGEYIIEVQFQNGRKTFLPEYQESKLQIIKD